MTTCKTGAEHIKSLKDGRNVYIDGQKVADVTVHPAFRNSVIDLAGFGRAGPRKDARKAQFDDLQCGGLLDARGA
jgi:aromatic ring hydroxylase